VRRLPLIALLLPALLAGCGGSSSGSTTATSAGTVATNPVVAPAQEQAAETKARATHVAIGSPSDVPRSKGGDNSVQNFGGEASNADLRAAAGVLAAYLDAYGAGDAQTACGLLAPATAQTLVQSFGKLAQRSGGSAPKDCIGLLQAMTAQTAGPRTRAQIRVAEALSLRDAGDRAFLIYRAGDGRVYAMPMSRQASSWRVAGIAAAPLEA